MRRAWVWYGLVIAVLGGVILLIWYRPWEEESTGPEPFFLAEYSAQAGKDWICRITPPTHGTFGFRVTSDKTGFEVTIKDPLESSKPHKGLLYGIHLDQKTQFEDTLNLKVRKAWFHISVPPLTQEETFSLRCYRVDDPAKEGEPVKPFFEAKQTLGPDLVAWSPEVDLGEGGKIRVVLRSQRSPINLSIYNEEEHRRIRELGLWRVVIPKPVPGPLTIRTNRTTIQHTAEPLDGKDSVIILIRTKEPARVRLECYQPPSQLYELPPTAVSAAPNR